MKSLQLIISCCLSFFCSGIFAQTGVRYQDSVLFHLTKAKQPTSINEQYLMNGLSFIDSLDADLHGLARVRSFIETFRTRNDKKTYYQLAYSLLFRLQLLKQYDQQIEYGRDVIKFYESGGDTTCKKYFLDILHSLRVPFRSTSRLSEGFGFYADMLKKYISTNDIEVVSLCYFVYGGFYMVQGLGDRATYYFKKSASYLNPRDTLASSRTGLQVWLDRAGTLPFLYNRIGNYREAVQFASAINAVGYTDKTRNDSMNRSLNLRLYAEAKMMLGEMDSVESPLKEAEHLALRTNSPENAAGCYELWGRYYFLSRKIDSAKKYLVAAGNIIEHNNLSRNSPWGIFTPNYYLAQIEAGQSRYQQAVELILKEMSEMPNLKREVLKEMKLLISVYMAMGANKEAHDAYQKYLSRQQEFDSTDQVNRVMSFEHEQMLEKMVIQKAIQDNEVIRQRKQKTLYLVGVLLLGTLLFFVFLNFRNQRRMNRLMNIDYEREKTELELKSQQGVLKERLRISRDLHDEVGATLSGIAMYSHLAKEQLMLHNSGDVEKSLGVIQESSIQMVNRLSDIVWLVNPNHDAVKVFFERLREYALELTAVKNIRLETFMDPAIPDMKMPIEARRNIYMICKEAINNAVKYSGSATLFFKAALSGDVVVFSIVDEGTGFEPAMARKGNGISNMQNRANEIDAQIQVLSQPGKGTSIVLYYKIIREGIG